MMKLHRMSIRDWRYRRIFLNLRVGKYLLHLWCWGARIMRNDLDSGVKLYEFFLWRWMPEKTASECHPVISQAWADMVNKAYEDAQIARELMQKDMLAAPGPCEDMVMLPWTSLNIPALAPQPWFDMGGACVPVKIVSKEEIRKESSAAGLARGMCAYGKTWAETQREIEEHIREVADKIFDNIRMSGRYYGPRRCCISSKACPLLVTKYHRKQMRMKRRMK